MTAAANPGERPGAGQLGPSGSAPAGPVGLLRRVHVLAGRDVGLAAFAASRIVAYKQTSATG
jgi:hypothetical protein